MTHARLLPLLTVLVLALIASPAGAIDIGDAASLQWEGDAQYGLRLDYLLERIPADVLVLLQPDVSPLVRYETLRRAEAYLSVRGGDPMIAAPLRNEVETALAARVSEGGALAAFDLGCWKALVTGEAYAPSPDTLEGLRTHGAEVAYVLARLDPRGGISTVAIDEAREGTLLAKNVLADFDHEYATLATLRTSLAELTSQETPFGFPQPPPVSGADPAVRHGVTLLAPWRLVVRNTAEGTAVTWAEETPWRVRVALGHRMVVGTRIEYGIFVDGERVAAHDSEALHGGEPLAATSATSFHQGVPSGAVFRARVMIFETDIPGQHHWSPSNGHYQVLWEHTYEATLP